VHDGEPVQPVPAELCANELTLQAGVTGTSAARHAGVEFAPTTIVVTCDAHMSFAQDWAVRLLAFFGEPAHARTVACATVYPCDEAFRPVPGKTRSWYAGARLSWLDAGEHEARALVAQWDNEQQPGEAVGCVMGAFYAFRREWYMQIGQPWSVGTGWGCDEELVSAASWICGGECRLLAGVHVYHVFDRPRALTVDDLAAIWLNRFRLLYLLPLNLDQAGRLYAAMMECRAIGGLESRVRERLDTDLARPEVKRLLAALSGRREAWEAYVREWVKMPPAPPQPRAGEPPPPAQRLPPRLPSLPPRHAQVIIVPAERCRACGAVNTFAKTDRDRTIPATDHAPKRQTCRCSACGAKGVRIFDGTVVQGREAVMDAVNA
jgi:hypothetical protein